ncbi:MAG TPA: polyketide synthase dehydratase domain-containing protein, partial [Mycobacterium sp.]|nr:polyketide synthase dehydratase domain-containing protein [Mycobacterium sp.]
LPTWNHRPLLLSRDGQKSQTRSAFTVSVHPLLGQHVRLLEEPERHVWQAEVGTAALPWLGDHQIHNVAALPAAAYCEMALTAARAVLGEASEVRDISFEQMLLLDDETPVGAVASVEAPGIAQFVMATNQDGIPVRQACAVLHAVATGDQPPAQDMVALLAEHSRREDGIEVRKRIDERGVQLGPAFTGLAAVHMAAEKDGTVLAQVGLPAPIRSQQAAYDVHPALLDACFQSIAAYPRVRDVGDGGLLLPLGIRRLRAYGPARNARYCYTRLTAAGAAGVEADLDVVDEHGAVLLTVRGLEMGSGVSQSGGRDRVLNERLLTIEWQQRALPEVDHADAGTWLLINTSDNGDLLATRLTDALKLDGARCTNMCWPQHSDHQANAELLGSHLGAGEFTGVVVLTGPQNGDPDEECAVRGADYVHHLVRIARELPEVPGEPPRLYLVTRKAQTVLSDDPPNLEQGGLRGLMRVIGAEHPHLRATQIDM